jgi:hypothetical protein
MDTSMPACPPNPFDPFDHIAMERVVENEEDWVLLTGRRQGRERRLRVRYDALYRQMDIHLRAHHGISLDDPVSFEMLEHATLRAAVAFLMD